MYLDELELMVCIFSFLQLFCFRGAIKIIFCVVLYSNILIYIYRFGRIQGSIYVAGIMSMLAEPV